MCEQSNTLPKGPEDPVYRDYIYRRMGEALFRAVAMMTMMGWERPSGMIDYCGPYNGEPADMVLDLLRAERGDADAGDRLAIVGQEWQGYFARQFGRRSANEDRPDQEPPTAA